MTRPAATLWLALTLLPAPLWAQRGFSLEQVLSAPFPWLLTAAPGGQVAWALNSAGARNVWVAAPPSYEPRPVSRFEGDEGLDLSELAWSADGGTLVFTRGTAADRAGEFPNPRGVAPGTARDLWWTAADGMARKLTDGGGGAISPKDGRVAFLKGGDIWWMEPRDTVAKPELLVNTRGAETLRWSPDGAQLAFVSRRDDHAFVGVLDLATRRVVWLDPALDNDSDPTWSPDGRSIAFLRQPAASDLFPFVPQRTGTPWSIRVADPATGVGREVWRAEPGQGSVFREISAPAQLLWAAGDHLVFPWERDGWTHLYSVPVTGGTAVLLTPGDFEVEDVALTGDRTAVVFSSNQGDIDRRHLWRVPAAGGAIVALTKGTGIESSPAPSQDGGTVVFLRSDARRPPRVAVLAGRGEPRDLQTDLIPAGFPTGRLVEPMPVVFPAADGLPIHAQLFRPADLKPGARCPAVIYFHGGSRRQMLLGWHYMERYRNAYAMNQYLVSQGFIVLSVNYRSGIGYGLEFREATNYGVQGASEYQDVVGAGLYLRARPDVVPDRIGLWGDSYGGYLTALGLARASALFRAGVDIHGVHDWNSEIRNWVPTYDPALQPEFAKRAFEASPLSSVDTWRSPVLLIHGDDDRNVPFSESVRLVHALRARGVETETLVFPDDIHFFLTHAHWIQAFRSSAEFLSRHLGSRVPPATSTVR